MPMTLRFEIFPSDLDATADFYTRILAFTVVTDQRDADHPYLELQRDDVRVGGRQTGPQSARSEATPNRGRAGP